MTEEKNELQVGVANGAIVNGERIIEDNKDYTIVQVGEKEFEKRMKYHKEWSYIPTTNEELLKFFELTNSTDDSTVEGVTAFKDAKGEIVEIVNYYFTPYPKFNKETGKHENGCTTMIEGADGTYFVTSSLKAYWDLRKIFETFGKPGTPGYLGAKVAIHHTKVKGEDGKMRDQMNLKLLGLSDNIKSAN